MNTVKTEVKNQKIEVSFQETKEIVAKNLGQEILDGTVKSFSVVDLWNIEKTQRGSQKLRRWLN